MQYAVSVSSHGWLVVEAPSPEQAERIVEENATRFKFGDLQHGYVTSIVNHSPDCETITFERWKLRNLGKDPVNEKSEEPVRE
jgi:hypothetical protein